MNRTASQTPAISRWIATACTHQGCVRPSNEDRFLVRQEAGLFAVADGMGGHEAGDVASAFVIDALTLATAQQTGAAGAEAIDRQLQHANRQLLDRAERSRRGMIGSTVVALLATGNEYVCLWAGDSRCYLRRDGALSQITNDHSLVRQLVEEGRLTAAEAKMHPRANVITRAVGASPDLTLERRRGAVRAGDMFVLCSDGLWGVLDDAEIDYIVAQTPMESAADALVERALRRGAPDNVTAVVAARS